MVIVTFVEVVVIGDGDGSVVDGGIGGGDVVVKRWWKGGEGGGYGGGLGGVGDGLK